MKKALSLVLVLVMVLGLTVPAFANTTSAGTWSYDSTKKAFTINCTIPEMMEVGSSIPAQVQLTGSCSGVTGYGAAWGKVYADNGFAYNGKKWDDPRQQQENTFVAGEEYGYLIYISYQPYELGDLSGAKIVLNGKEYDVEVSIPYDKNDVDESTSSQIFIAIDFGVLNENGSFSGGDFAEPEEDGKSGTTTLTATKAEPFRYEIVFPTSVEPITAAGVYEVGQAKVKDVVSATEKTVISYTATTTAFKLSTDESKTLAATYHTEQAATNPFPTTAVKVYENKADAASLPTMYVKIADTDWNAAAAGTYTATVTFNFEAKEAEALPATMTIAAILATAESAIPNTMTPGQVPDGAWKSGENSCFIEQEAKLTFHTSDGGNTNIKIFNGATANEAQLTEGNYVYTSGTKTCTFVMQNGKLTTITFSYSDYTNYNGTYTAPTMVTVTFNTTGNGMVVDENSAQVTSITVPSGTPYSIENGFQITIGSNIYKLSAGDGSSYTPLENASGTIAENTEFTIVFH